MHLKKLFQQAYPGEELTSGILLQRFLTGLAPRVSKQILLQGQPTSFDQAVERSKDVKYALNFETKPTEPASNEINAISQPHPTEGPQLALQLHQALDQMTKRLEALETRLPPNSTNQAPRSRNPARNRRRSNNYGKYAPVMDQDCSNCWECGEPGHFQRDCPHLNYHGPARSVDGWPRK